jgi:hypothetical protein
MPLPSLKTYKAAAANALEHRKRVLLGESPEAAAHAVSAPVQVLETHPASQALAETIGARESKLLAQAGERAALESREGRQAWLSGVILGHVKYEGSFGIQKDFPPAAKIACARLLGLMHGDFTTKHEVSVSTDAVLVFAIPDNGRVPRELIVDALPDEES